MKNKVKRLLSAVLALAMVISMLPGMRLDAFAEGDVCPECNGTGKQCEHCGGTGICDVCGGTGLCDGCEGSKEPVECYLCEGEGHVVCEECEGEDPDCSECGGEGEFVCDYCKGTGSADCYFCEGTGACVYCEGSKKCSYCAPCSTCNGTGKAELELPETLNDLEVTWPEGAHFGKGGIIQCVHDLTAVEGEYFHDNRNNRIYRVSSLTKGKYAVCAFGCEVILDEPFDDTAECLVCHHLASSHWSGGAPVDADNDRISYCKDCGDVYQTRCSGYTWAECLEGGNGAELPEKLNGFIATWPEGTYINGNGEIRCTHASPIFKDGRLISPGGSMAEFGLTAGAYTVCTAGCQVTLRDAPIPDTLNGYSVKWPENIRYDRGTATCPHGTTIFSDNTVHGVDNTWAVEELTENAYTVCERGCQILVGNVTPTDPLAGLKAMLEGKTEDACVTLFMNDVLHTGVAKIREQLNSIQNATGVKQDVGSNADWIIYTNTTGICFFHLADKHEETASGCKFCGYKYQCPHDNADWDDGALICRNCGDVLETCNHEGTPSGRCKNCGMIIGSTTTGPLAEIYAALKGKNDADVCTGVDNYSSAMPVRGIDSVGWALSRMKNALSVSKTSPGYWTVIGPDYEYTVYVLDTHNFTDDTCVACGFRCTHNGAASGTCGICGVNLDALVTCEICGGSGKLNMSCHRCRDTKECDMCRGTGEMPWGADCYDCGGSGICQECINGFPCDYCNGMGMAPRIIWATGLTLDMTAITIKVGEMVSIPVTVIPENATFKSVWWESDNWEVAGFMGVGTEEGWKEGVVGFAPGTAILTAHRDDLTATCVLTVEAPHEHDGITFDKEIPATGGTLTAGNYYLAEDLTLSANLTISGTVNLCLNGHVLKGTGSGSVITVNSGAVLNLYDCNAENSGTITGGNNGTKNVGGGGVLVRGTFNMYGGSISGNTASNNSHGGGVNVKGTFNMNGGVIQNNYSTSQAGGVFVAPGGKFTLKDGAIANNTAGNGGAGVYLNGACSFIMNGGTISGNTSRGSQGGGGVRVENANCFTMNGGSITGNTTAYAGGGVNASTLIMNGGTISGNKSSGIGGGVSAGAVTLGGNATITGNTRGSAVQNVYLADGKLITVNSNFTGTVGVTTANAAGAVISSNAVDETAAQHFTADNSALEVRRDTDGKLIVAVPVYPVTGVTLDMKTVSMDIGDTLTLTAIVAPENATNQNVTWESDNANVAAVENGVVTAAAPGEATITVTTEDGSFTASCVVTVIAPTVSVTGVTLDMKAASMKVGETLTLTAAVAPEDADNKNVSWESNNTDAVTVENGVVTAVAPGEATITVTTEDGEFTATCVVTVVPQYQFTVTADVGGHAEGSGIISEGDDATARAYADKGYTFSHWEDANGNKVSSNSSCTVTIMADTTLKAVFEELPKARIFVSLDVQEMAGMNLPTADVKVAGNSFAVKVNEPLEETSGAVLQGEKVTVIAHSTEDATFVRWQTEKGILLSEKAEYSFQVAEYNKVVAAYRVAGQTVTFTDRKGNTLSSRQYQATANAEDILVPTAPAMFGYDFKGWKLSGTDTVVTDDQLKQAILAEIAADRDVELNAVYEPLPEQYTITVMNGSGSGTYNASTALTVKANAAPAGKHFAGWYEGETLLTTNASYSFYVTADRALEARFVDTPVEPVGTTRIETVSPNTSTKKISFVSVSSVPTSCTIEKAGVIATSDASVGTDAQKFTVATAAFVRYGTTTAHNYNYTWTKGSVTAGQTWYVRAYLVYKDANGNSHTVYGDIVAATLNGTVG